MNASADLAPLVFITGASSGLGQALATRYAQAGWRLALVARRTDLIRDWVSAQGLSPDRVAVYGADVADIDAIVRAGQACLRAQGVPDVVIANAGISVGMDTAQRQDLDVMARTFAINTVGLAATFHPGRYCQRGGHPRLARAWRLLRQQGRSHQLLRIPAR